MWAPLTTTFPKQPNFRFFMNYNFSNVNLLNKDQKEGDVNWIIASTIGKPPK